MSDPVSNVEIEDVLTSIRRLVSDGEWGQTPAPVKEQAAEQASSNDVPSKFVLTPALRVVEPVQAPEPATEWEAEEEQSHYEEPSSESEPLDALQEEHSFEQPEHGSEDDRAEENHVEDTQTEEQKPSLEEVIADLEAAVEHSHEWEDVSEDYDDDGDELTFETASFDHGSSYQPDAADQAFSAELDEDLAAYMDDENIIDEEALRKLVAEVIRQELQGALGERITRNVRKLVRREIYRILASEDFN